MMIYVRFVLLVTWVTMVLTSVRAQSPQKPLFRDFMGINGHTVQFKPELYRSTCRLVRDYHPIDWDFGDQTGAALNFPKAANGVDWNALYGSWKQDGFKIDACLMFDHFNRENWSDLSADAMRYGRDFATHFGPASERALVEAVEIGNEPGKYSDDDYIELFKSMAGGIRQADAKMKIATCNVYAGAGGDYHKSADLFLDLGDYYDVLSIHSYAMLSSWPKWERSHPEDDRFPGFIRDIDRLIHWRDENAVGKEVWLTEFGYDSSTKLPTADDEFAQWQGNSDLEQAQWLVRSFFLFATRDIERAYIFFFNDEDVPKLHNASGLTRNFQPKPSFYAVSHLFETLGDYRFERIVQHADGERDVYEFTHASDNDRVVWVAWSPTGGGVSSEIRLPTAGHSLVKAERMPTSADAVESVAIKIVDGEMLVPIDESPLYLWLDGTK